MSASITILRKRELVLANTIVYYALADLNAQCVYIEISNKVYTTPRLQNMDQFIAQWPIW